MTQPQWEPGKLLQQARQTLGLSKAAAARRSGLSTSWWHRLESGLNIVGGEKIPINPSSEALIKAAHGVDLDPRVILTAAGIEADIGEVNGTDARLINLISQLDEDQKTLVLGFVHGIIETGR